MNKQYDFPYMINFTKRDDRTDYHHMAKKLGFNSLNELIGCLLKKSKEDFHRGKLTKGDLDNWK